MAIDARIVAALVSGGLGLVGGLATGYKDELRSIFTRSKRTIAGAWIGTAVDKEIPGLLEYAQVLQYQVRCELKHRGERITGDVWVEADTKYRLKVVGRVEDSTYVFAEYHNRDSNTTDRGYVLLKLAGTGDRLSGLLLGRGMREDGVALVEVKLARDGEP
jgi:hypothetical protein